MFCKTCGYRLWNLTERRCPECGTPFRPSEFEFVPNSVQFCCPHCRQPYYGTTAKGHLSPTTFTCVQCGQPLHMDDMVLLPAPGLEEQQTRVARVPWLELQERGLIKAWLATVGMALVSPLRLMRALPVESPAAPAWGFALRTLVLTLVSASLPMWLFMLAVVPRFGRAPGASAMVGVVLAIMGISLAAIVLALLLWGLLTHAALRLSGRTAGPLGRTCQALCYSTGANILSAVPCLGPYVGWIWWAISAVLMVKEAQRVGAVRATAAVCIGPLLIIGAVVGLYVWSLAMAFSGWTGMAGSSADSTDVAVLDTQLVLDGLMSYAETHGGRGPRHAVELTVTDDLSASDFVSIGTETDSDSVSVAGVTLDQLEDKTPNERRRVADAAIAALPPTTSAHRLGDFVFVYHGLDLEAADPCLWVVIGLPMRAPNSQPPTITSVPIGLADGTVMEVPFTDLPAELETQNDLRTQAGLPPLPDPQTVTHECPAVKNGAG